MANDRMGNTVQRFTLQVDTLDLNIDELCDSSGNPFMDKILHVWKNTNSPFWGHWRKLIDDSTLLGTCMVARWL